MDNGQNGAGMLNIFFNSKDKETIQSFGLTDTGCVREHMNVMPIPRLLSMSLQNLPKSKIGGKK